MENRKTQDHNYQNDIVFLKNKTKKFFQILLIIFLTTIIQYNTLHSTDLSLESSKRVLLLNSYHKGYLWTDEITRGIEETFDGHNIDLHIEYMDTKRQFDNEFQTILSKLLRLKHIKHDYKLVISSDNNAFDYFRNRGSTIFKDIPLVFCGVNYLKKENLKEITNVTGVNEKADIAGNIKLIKHLHPKCNKIVVITDNTTTGKRVQEEVLRINSSRNHSKTDPIKKSQIKYPKVELIYDVSASELINFVKNQDNKTVLLYTLFFRDKSGNFFEYDKGTKMVCENTNIPVYGTWNFSLGHGIIGGYLTSGFDQGVSAAKKGLAIIKGQKARNIPVQYETPTRLRFDYNQLKKHNISHSKLPKKSEILFQPVSFYYQHKNLIWNTILIFCILLLGFFTVTYGLIRTQQAKKLLHRSEENLRITLNSIGDAVIATDIAGIITGLNPVAEKITGWIGDEAVGQPLERILKLVNNKTLEPLENPVENILKKGQITDLPNHTILISKDQKKYHVADSAAPIKDNEGNITGVVLVFRDITEGYRMQERLQAERDYSTSIINEVPAIICGIAPDGKCTFINPAGEQATGYNKEELLGKNWWKTFFPGDDYKQVEKLFINLECKPVNDYEMTLTRKDKKKRIVSWNSFDRLDMDGNKIEIIGFGHDITKKKQDEEKLKTYQEQLEKLVRKRTLALEKEKKKAEIANRTKSDFLANMSHELRTPLNAVIGFSELLSSLMVDKKQKNYVNSIKVAGKSLLTLINDILDLSKIELGKLEIKEDVFSLSKILGEIEHIFKDKSEKKGLKFKIKIEKDIPDFLILDEVRIRQILLNLVGNAEKFTEKGYIQIKIKRLSKKIKEDSSKIDLAILVEDSGIGIHHKDINSIFESFKQQEKLNTKKYGGTGLGLSICKKLTNAMGGKISVKSTLGKGTVFKIELKDIPIAAFSYNTISREDSFELESTKFEKATILVVDDIESNRKMVQEILIKIGFKVISAKNGKIAIELIEKNKIDFIFMDIRMPVLDGVETTIRIKKNKKTKNIPIVALTASSTKKNENVIKKSGFNDFLYKPFKVHELLSILSRFFNYTTDKTKKDKKHSLSDLDLQTLKNPEAFIELLNNEILVTLNSLKDVIILSKIKGFGKKIEETAEKYKIPSLSFFGKNISDYADNFDTIGIKNELYRLSDEIKLLNEKWRNFIEI